MAAQECHVEHLPLLNPKTKFLYGYLAETSFRRNAPAFLTNFGILNVFALKVKERKRQI